MITKAEWLARQQQWAEYRRWLDSAPPVEHPLEHVIADVGAILEWIPESERAKDHDPDRLGVQRMHLLLSLLKPR